MFMKNKSFPSKIGDEKNVFKNLIHNNGTSCRQSFQDRGCRLHLYGLKVVAQSRRCPEDDLN